jgi:enoyl-CoA hydratase/carnithine racemase
MAPDDNPVTLAVDDGVARIRLNRGRGNAINTELVDGLLDTFREAEADDRVSGALLCASGKLFCPGLDLHELSSFDRPQLERFMSRFHACLLRMYTFSKPLVAALSGHTLAGGMVLALTADWRVLRRGALVGLNELRVGVPLPFGVSLMLREGVVASRLEEVALFGRNYADEDAVAASLVHELHDEEGFEAYCTERLAEMARRDPASFAITKRYLRSATVERIRANDARFLGEFLDCWFSETTQRRVADILSKIGGAGE